MTYLLTKDNGLVYRNNGLVVGPCPECCGPPPPSPTYVPYIPCQTANPHPCQGPPPEREIYLTPGMVCGSSGLTLAQILAQTGSLPAIYWAGWCWVPTIFTEPGWVLPPGAISPSQPLNCIGGCSDPLCPPGPRYVALRRCEGQPGATTQPPYVVCMAEVMALRAAGKRCPTIGFGGFCWFFDWANPFLTIPANYTLTTIGALAGNVFPSCCECLPEPCTTAIAVDAGQCPGVPGVRLGDDCCAHGLLGTANVSWVYDAFSTNDIFRDLFTGQATRADGVVTGTWNRKQYVSGTLIADETFPYTFTLNDGEVFRPDNMIPFEALPGGVTPGCLAPGSCSGSWQSSCRSYVYNAECVPPPRPGPRWSTSINYQCSPNPGYCGQDCPSSASTQPNIGPGGGDSTSPGDLTDAVDSMMRSQYGRPCQGCGQ